MSTAPLQPVLTGLGISQARLARELAMPKSTVCQIVTRGQWPRRDTQDIKTRMGAYLIKHGATAVHLGLLREAGIFTTLPGPQADAEPPTDQPQEDTMLLEKVKLSAEARKHFSLTRDPFLDEITARADVWSSPSTRFVRAALLDAAMHHGFIAIHGESGSGKSTLREELEERVRDESRPIIIIKPYTLDMEPSDARGKMMKSGRIAEAIARALAPSMQLKSSPEARLAQVHDLLRNSCLTGNRHLLVIEEAHRMPLATLKHLKGWMELKDGLRRLLGVCLIGQPELDMLLSEQRPEIREIVQRCEKVRMEPLDADVEDYLKHKFDRVGVRAADVLAEDAYDALRARLIYLPRGGRASDAVSICYPLAVNNCIGRAINAAAKAGWPKVDAQVIASC